MNLGNIIDTSGTLPHITMSLKDVIAITKNIYTKQQEQKLIESLRVKDIKDEKIVHFWLYMKTFFINGTFYRYSPERLSNLTGVSPNTIRKYISILSNANWVRKHSGNITCIDRRDVQQVDKYYFRRKDYKKGLSFSDFRDILVLKMINQEAKKQEYAIKTKNILKGKEATTTSGYRKARSIDRKYGMNWKEYLSKVVFSYRSLASKLNLSHSTIKGHVTSLVSKGLLNIKRSFLFICNGTYIDYINYKKYSNSNIRFKNGKIWLDLGWEILS